MNGQQPTLEALGLFLSDAEGTKNAGISLSKTLYNFPLDIGLSGPVGSGKTSFLQGFFFGLGIQEHITSPTYALEQRYKTSGGMEVLHIDLYRLSKNDAQRLLESTHDHPGIRCIEWPEIAGIDSEAEKMIALNFSEERNGRMLNINFRDASLPSSEDINQWRRDVGLPSHIIAHCNAVASFALKLAEYLIDRGTVVRRKALQKSAELHDLFRFVDFRGGAGPGPEIIDPRWEPWKKKYSEMRHEAACAEFLKEKGYDAVAKIVSSHGLRLPPGNDSTVEQMLLFYADKRVAMDQVVSLKERFDDFRQRYSAHAISLEQSEQWYREARGVEAMLFPEGVPY